MESIDKKLLKKNVEKLISPKVLVIGDLAIDEMIYGDTERISREAPVLILQHSHTNILLGGASNAAHNISTINEGKVSVLGVYGDDYHGPLLLEAFRKAGVDTKYMIKDVNRATIVKTRISGSCSQSITQQIVRIDRQTNAPLTPEIEAEMIKNIKKAIPEFDAIILSDYHIGTLTQKVIDETIKIANKNNKIIVVDAQKDLHKYKNVTALTPNQPDTEKFVGFFIKDDKDLENAAKIMLEKTNAEMILVTRGEHGMFIYDKSGSACKIPAFNRSKVFDVTGAGDTVVASFTTALAAGLKPKDAMIIGNLAASLVIRVFGCGTVNINDLKEAVDKTNFIGEEK